MWSGRQKLEERYSEHTLDLFLRTFMLFDRTGKGEMEAEEMVHVLLLIGKEAKHIQTALQSVKPDLTMKVDYDKSGQLRSISVSAIVEVAGVPGQKDKKGVSTFLELKNENVLDMQPPCSEDVGNPVRLKVRSSIVKGRLHEIARRRRREDPESQLHVTDVNDAVLCMDDFMTVLQRLATKRGAGRPASAPCTASHSNTNMAAANVNADPLTIDFL